MERHRRLAGARRPLDDRHPGAGATDHDVLLGLDRGHHVLHATGPRGVERSHQRTLAHEVEPGLACGADVEDLVLQPDQLALPPAEVASPYDTHGVVRQRPVERLGGRRPPVDDERITVLVRHGRRTHVEAAAVGEVETTHEQPLLRDVGAASRWPAWAMALSRSNSACAFLVSVTAAIPAMPSAEPRMARARSYAASR